MIIYLGAKGSLQIKKKKKCNICYIASDPPPANVMKNTMYFSKKLDHFWGTFAKKKLFAPIEKSKHLSAKISEK